MTYHSQNNEAEVIVNYFNGFKGTLLDCGANDGKTFSNSYDLINLGWAAYLLEPSGAFDALRQLHHGNEAVKCLNFGLSTENGEKVWYECADTLLSTTHHSLTVRHGQGRTSETLAKFQTFHKFHKLQNYPKFDFITIDAEGEDWAILQQIELDKVGCKCICIEYGSNLDRMKAYCEGFGLRRILQNGENLIMAA